MNLTSELTALRNSSLSVNERAEFACRLAKQLEKGGAYEGAAEVLAEFWPNRDEPPNVSELEDSTKAELHLRVGALQGWLNGADQIEQGQETAKNLITMSIEVFEKLGDAERLAEARGDLALCYWREGAYDEARINLNSALAGVPTESSELRAILLIRAGIVETWAQRLQEAMRYYIEAAPLVAQSG